MASQRVTRSKSKAESLASKIAIDLSGQDSAASEPEACTVTLPDHPAQSTLSAINANTAPQHPRPVDVASLPSPLTRKATKLSSKEHVLMLLKQQKLQNLNIINTFKKQDRFVTRSSKSNKLPPADEGEDEVIQRVCAATFIFASESAGTAICIDESGLLLTCAHCVADSEEESRSLMMPNGKALWLLASSGCVVQAKCVAWDERRDLALLRIVSAQFEPGKGARFEYVDAAPSMCKRQTRICCVGHPGSEDLEAEEVGVATDYPVLAISEGVFLGYAEGHDVQDNSEIGALEHNAWTYWGHSGAPLVDLSDGKLIGLHSSWDDETGTRRGVGTEAINSFLSEFDL